MEPKGQKWHFWRRYDSYLFGMSNYSGHKCLQLHAHITILEHDNYRKGTCAAKDLHVDGLHDKCSCVIYYTF